MNPETLIPVLVPILDIVAILLRKLLPERAAKHIHRACGRRSRPPTALAETERRQN